MKATLKRSTPSDAHQSRIAYDWDKERKKLTVLSVIFVMIFALVGIILTICVLRGYL